MSDLIFYGVFVLLALCLLSVVLNKRLRGRVFFGGEVVKSWDGVIAKQKFGRCKIKVHAVNCGARRLVCLEIIKTSLLS